jgi:hypothetical protein
VGADSEIAIDPIWEASTSTACTRLIFLLLVALVAAATGMVWWLTPEPLPVCTRAELPQPVFVNQQLALITPASVLTAELAAYNDELFAYLMFDYLRHSPLLRKTRLLLAFDPKAANKPYRLIMRGQTDLIGAIADVAAMQLPGSGPARNWELTPAQRVEGIEQQTRLFISAYNLPVRRKLEDLSRESLSSYLRRFIRFKSTTDPRIRLKLEPVPKPLSSGDAQRLAGDIITVAEFFSLPLEFFLGIAAMENNYMDVRGDLNHSIWKRRPAPDDTVLERRRGRVRVLNDSAGVWQITRETLRYAHKLVLSDPRDYLLLPEHLRPPAALNVNEVSPQVLTTYAGRLLRDLLDRFDGDVTLAVSAYNGGPARPNLRYGAGVHRAAAHARRVLEQSAALNGESVVRMTWLRRP